VSTGAGIPAGRGRLTGRRALLAAALSGWASSATAAPDRAALTTTSANDFVIGGGPNTPLVIEYASLTCGHCRDFHAQVWPTIKKDFVDRRRIRFAHRPMPTPPTDMAIAGYLLAARAASGNPARFHALVGDMFARQAEFIAAARAGTAARAYEDWALANGLRKADFTVVLQDKAAIDRVIAVATEAESLGVVSTPTVFIDGMKLESIAANFTPAGMTTALEAAIARRRRARR
jgi:protein-disulfide isomerase